MREVLLDGGPAAVGALTRALRTALAGGPAVLPLAAADPRVDDVRAAMAPDRPVEPGTAVIVCTSGSTGAPKGVLLAASALLASARATHEVLGGPGRWLLAMPAHHVAGVQVLVRSLVAGHEPVVLSGVGGFRPAGFAEAAGAVLERSGPHYTALVPTQLSRLVLDGGAGLAALRAFDAVLLGGAATPEPLLARARDVGVRVRTTYGMSETAGGCVYDGRPLPGVRVRIGATGLIELAGPTLASGYRLRPRDPAFAGGWFHTADLGELSDGTLRVLGRADDMINTGGVKVAAAAVERILAAQPGVVEACVVGLPDPEWGSIVAAGVVASGPLDRVALRAAVRTALGARAVPKLIEALPELPLRGPGKPDKRAVTTLLTRDPTPTRTPDPKLENP